LVSYVWSSLVVIGARDPNRPNCCDMRWTTRPSFGADARIDTCDAPLGCREKQSDKYVRNVVIKVAYKTKVK